MGALTVRHEWPAWRAAGAATAVSAAAVVGTGLAAGGLGLPVVVAAAAVPVLAAGLLAGFGPPVVIAVVVQTLALAGAVVVGEDAGREPASVAVAVGVLLWVAFELACSSLELRPARSVRRAALASRVADGVLVASVGGLTGLLALGAAGLVEGGGAPLLRLAGVVVVAAAVGAALVLSARVRGS